MIKNLPFLLLFAIALPLNLFGQNHHDTGHSESHEFHKHHGAVFVGSTYNLESEHNSLTAGAEYEFRFHKSFGVGILGEAVFADHTESIVAVSLLYHFNSLTVLVAQGKVFPDGDESHNLTRFGINYGFHFGKISVAPSVSYDLISHNNSLVAGLLIGFGF